MGSDSQLAALAAKVISAEEELIRTQEFDIEEFPHADASLRQLDEEVDGIIEAMGIENPEEPRAEFLRHLSDIAAEKSFRRPLRERWTDRLRT